MQSYVHQNHAPSESWLPNAGDSHVGRTSGKGNRLIILHAISKFGPIGKVDTGMTWKGDTPHPCATGHEFCGLTAETLWTSKSNSGDYHSNMNSIMFMKWVEEKLCPAFKLFCDKEFGEQRKMILVLDNAPYHHNRGVKSLSALKGKAELVQLVKETLLEIGRITHIVLPAVAGKREDPLRIKIADIDGSVDAKPNLPQVPTVKELETIWLEKMDSKENLRALMECKLERYLRTQVGAEFLWTPPYCPTLQPIEEFWGAGKNYVASQYFDKRKMKSVIDQLRDGWYGNAALGKEAVPCHRLIERAMDDADRRMTEVGGLSGSMRTGVTVLEGAEVYTSTRGEGDPVVQPLATDMRVPVAPITNQQAGADDPHVLGEEGYVAAAVSAVMDGSAEQTEAGDEGAGAALNAPPGSPAATASSRRRRRGPPVPMAAPANDMDRN